MGHYQGNRNAEPEALTDGDLARRISDSGGGPATAEEAELCRRYERRIYWYGLRHLGAEDRARDLVQDVLVVTIEKLRAGEVREPERVGSFILGTARMTARSTARTGAREDGIEAVRDIQVSTEPTAADPIGRERVVRCLQQLAERLRTVIVLTYFGDESTASIASSLGLTANNVRVTRYRAIEQLRGCLRIGDRVVAT